MKSNNQPVLLVDDNQDDRFLVGQAWTESGIKTPLREVGSGLEAVAYLSGSGGFADRIRFPIPCLVLLDIMMPGMTGFSVLEHIRNDPATRLLPVVMFTASTSPHDVVEAYRRGTNSFMIKPSSFSELKDMLSALEHYWLRHNVFPPPKENRRPYCDGRLIPLLPDYD